MVVLVVTVTGGGGTGLPVTGLLAGDAEEGRTVVVVCVVDVPEADPAEDGFSRAIITASDAPACLSAISWSVVRVTGVFVS